MTRVVYIAGPMRGHEDFNFPAFFEAEARLRDEDHAAVVFNPARRDEQVYGPAIASNPHGDVAVAAAQHGFDLREALAADLEFVCLYATEVHLLRGWENSRGATAEYAAAIALGLLVTFESEPF